MNVLPVVYDHLWFKRTLIRIFFEIAHIRTVIIEHYASSKSTFHYFPFNPTHHLYLSSMIHIYLLFIVEYPYPYKTYHSKFWTYIISIWLISLISLIWLTWLTIVDDVWWYTWRESRGEIIHYCGGAAALKYVVISKSYGIWLST